MTHIHARVCETFVCKFRIVCIPNYIASMRTKAKVKQITLDAFLQAYSVRKQEHRRRGVVEVLDIEEGLGASSSSCVRKRHKTLSSDGCPVSPTEAVNKTPTNPNKPPPVSIHLSQKIREESQQHSKSSHVMEPVTLSRRHIRAQTPNTSKQQKSSTMSSTIPIPHGHALCKDGPFRCSSDPGDAYGDDGHGDDASTSAGVESNEMPTSTLGILQHGLPEDVDPFSCTFVAVKRNSNEIAKIFDILKDMCKTIALTVSQDCITGEAVDQTHMIIVCLWLERAGFDIFYHKDDYSTEKTELNLCLFVEEFCHGIRCMNTFIGSQRNNTNMTIYHKQDDPNNIGLFCASNDRSMKSDRVFPNMLIPKEHMSYDNIHLCAAMQMLSNEFRLTLSCTKSTERVENLAIHFCFQGDVEHGEPNKMVQPIIKVVGGTSSAPCRAVNGKVSFIAPTKYETKEDATARILLKNAVWRDGCVPPMSHLKQIDARTWGLPVFVYNKDMLMKISQAFSLDSMVCIFVDIKGVLIMRYNVGTLGAVLFIVAPNENDALAKSMGMQNGQDAITRSSADGRGGVTNPRDSDDSSDCDGSSDDLGPNRTGILGHSFASNQPKPQPSDPISSEKTPIPVPEDDDGEEWV